MVRNNLIFGTHPILEAIKDGKDFDKIFLQKGIQSEIHTEIFLAAKRRGIPALHVPLEKLNRITRKNHQGVAGFTAEIEFHDLKLLVPQIYEEGKVPFILILDQVSDVRNFGAIVRTAECAGVDAVVIPHSGSASINEDAIKTSAGALLKMPICRMKSLDYTVNFLKESGFQVIGCTEKTKETVYDLAFMDPTAIVMGNEEKGISRSVMDLCDGLAKIPLNGHIRSLNVSVAAAIICYEVVRQRLS